MADDKNVAKRASTIELSLTIESVETNNYSQNRTQDMHSRWQKALQSLGANLLVLLVVMIVPGLITYYFLDYISRNLKKDTVSFLMQSFLYVLLLLFIIFIIGLVMDIVFNFLNDEQREKYSLLRKIADYFIEKPIEGFIVGLVAGLAITFFDHLVGQIKNVPELKIKGKPPIEYTIPGFSIKSVDLKNQKLIIVPDESGHIELDFIDKVR